MIEFYHGALTPKYEQGLTLGDKSGYFEEIKAAYTLLLMEGLLTDKQSDQICRKIHRKLCRNLKPLRR